MLSKEMNPLKSRLKHKGIPETTGDETGLESSPLSMWRKGWGEENLAGQFEFPNLVRENQMYQAGSPGTRAEGGTVGDRRGKNGSG